MKQISREDFLKVYNGHSPNLFLRIMFKYFSTDMKKSLGTQVIVTLFIAFTVLSIFFQQINLMSARNKSLIIANIPFVTWGISAFIAFKWNQLRTKKIQKTLGLTIDEYNFYADIYVTQ